MKISPQRKERTQALVGRILGKTQLDLAEFLLFLSLISRLAQICLNIMLKYKKRDIRKWITDVR
jgi:hypothetical protein